MPLTAKGEKILEQFKKEYGEEKGERYFYASKNAGRIRGVDSAEVNAPILVKETPPPDESRLPKEVRPVPVNTVVGSSDNPFVGTKSSPPSSIPVGDSSLANMNARNRAFWNRK